LLLLLLLLLLCRIDHKAGTQIAIKIIDLEEM
jgi:hypothetical protein